MYTKFAESLLLSFPYSDKHYHHHGNPRNSELLRSCFPTRFEFSKREEKLLLFYVDRQNIQTCRHKERRGKRPTDRPSNNIAHRVRVGEERRLRPQKISPSHSLLNLSESSSFTRSSMLTSGKALVRTNRVPNESGTKNAHSAGGRRI